MPQGTGGDVPAAMASPAVSPAAAVVTVAWLALLLLLVPTATAVVADEAECLAEAAVMQSLRRALHAAAPRWTDRFTTWQPDGPDPPCQWEHVECDTEGHIASIMVITAARRPAVPQTPSAALPPHNDSSGCNGTGSSSGSGCSSDACSSLPTSGGNSLPGQILLPELSQLQWLTVLVLALEVTVPQAIPMQWGVPGSFRNLFRLQLSAPTLNSPLPDIQPGALPRLETLRLGFERLSAHTTLPASWGGGPGVLPALRQLLLRLPLQPAAAAAVRLPPEWAHGFRRLQDLSILSSPPSAGPSPATPPQHAAGTAATGAPLLDDPCLQPSPGATSSAAVAPPPLPCLPPPLPAAASAERLPPEAAAVAEGARLPAEWARGFPELGQLTLSSLGLTGPIPSSWLRGGGFPRLVQLSLPDNALTGALPRRLLCCNSSMTHLDVSRNRFSGSLPRAWSNAGVQHLLLAGNALTGPAFPPAWLRPGALPHLSALDLSTNTRLIGALPASMPWAELNTLVLSGTGVEGRVPSTWCQSPAASTLRQINIGNTSIDPALPGCAMDTMPALRTVVGTTAGGVPAGDVPADGVLARWQPAGESLPLQPPARATGWAVQLTVCALAAAGAIAGAVVGSAVWWRLQQRRQQQAAQQRVAQQREAVRLLPEAAVQPGTASNSSDAAAVGRLLPAWAGGRGGVQRNRRHRISRLLGDALKGSSPGLRLLPLELLPAALAHNLGTLNSRPAPEPGPGTAAGPGGRAHPDPVATRWPAGLHARPATDARLGLPCGDPTPGCKAPRMPTGRLEAGPESAVRGTLASRQWRLDTRSLQLAPGELQLTEDSRGHLVVLGVGSHAVVFLAHLGVTPVAVKVIELAPGIDSHAVWREVALLHRCTHRRIVPLYGVAIQGHLILMAMQLLLGGSLRAALQQDSTRHSLRWEESGRQVALDVAGALAHMHHMNVMHSDLKSSNVLLSPELRAHIADLGISQSMGSHPVTAAGRTIRYAAPEQLLGQRCTLAADVYSLGLLLIELFTQHQGTMRGDWRLPLAPQECPQAVVPLIQACISQDPLQRPSADHVLQQLRAAA